MEPMLSLQNISKTFDDLKVLDHMNLGVGRGEIVALVGPSGSGKTTLLNIISGIEQADHGGVHFDGQKISYMFQDPRLLPWKTVAENILLVNSVKNIEAMRFWLRAVGLEQFEHYYPAQLSGGMARRCALARAFYYGGDFFLMDEPFSGLDYGLRMEMIDILLNIRKNDRPGILFVTHEIDEALTVASRIVLIGGKPTHDIQNLVLPGLEGRNPALPELSPYRQTIINAVSQRY